MPLAQSRLAPATDTQLPHLGCLDGSALSSELKGGPSTSATSSHADDKSPEAFAASSPPLNIDLPASGHGLKSILEPEGSAQAMVLSSPRPCSDTGTPLPLSHDTSGETSLLPFDPKELASLPDPMCPDLTIQLGFAVRDVVQTLPDDSPDSQAQVLRFIVQFVRTRGLRCTYWFKDRSLEELRAALTGDASFSAAIRICADKTYSKLYADSLFQVICHVCRRPPAYRSRKSVRFAESVQTIKAQASYPNDPPELKTPALAPFIADDLARLHDPFSPDTMTHLMLESAFCIQRLADDPEGGTEVHVVRGIFDVLLDKKLLVPNFLTELDTAGLREVLKQDAALWETLGSLRALLRDRDTGSFYHNFTLIMRYLGRSLRL